jgi:hypothetical protein
MRDKVRDARALARLNLGAGVTITVLAALFSVGSGQVMWPTWIGLAGMVVGLLLMVAIHRAAPEPDTRMWRYRALPLAVRQGSESYGSRGREIGRSMIILAAACLPMALFAYVARPGFFGFQPRFLGLTVDEIALLVGFGGMAVGLGWMIRIYRADPEPDEPTWRYRS